MKSYYDLAVVGGGPGGIAAAVTAAEGGLRVVLVDESPRLGGQIWREDLGTVPAPARPWIRRLHEARVEVRPGASVWHAETPSSPGASFALHTTDGSIRARHLALACGARELFLPFSGWTLPGVLGVGGIQALAHSGLEVRDRRVVIAGSGPLLVQVAKGLERHGARVVRIAEQAPLSRLVAFSARLGLSKSLQALRLATTKLRSASWVVEARGEGRVEEVVVASHSLRDQITDRITGLTTETIACDYAGVGFGLVPNLELPRALGCAIEEGAVRVDDRQRTSVEGVFAVGELCGIKGAPGAIADGACCGLVAAGVEPSPRWLRARDRENRFAVRLARAFALRPELRRLARPDTLLCRCEGVAIGRVAEYNDWTSAKLHTRCGMGLCQARVCGPAAEALFGWGPTTVRPPLLPIPIDTLLSAEKLSAESGS